MRNLELSEELWQYFRKNSEYIFTEKGSDENLFPFIDVHQQFRNHCLRILIDAEFSDVEDIINKLSKYSGFKIRNKILFEYRQLCSFLRVLNLFSSHGEFFLSAFENIKKLDEIFGSNQAFRKLNVELTDIFHLEDKRVYQGFSYCKGKYYNALKGYEFIYLKSRYPTGIESGNFGELSAFFIDHPLISNFFDDHLDEITRYANLYLKQIRHQSTTLNNFTPGIFKLGPVKINVAKKRKLEPPNFSNM